jgi:hypothetical protein
MGVRCGGNTQERAEMVNAEQIPDGRSLAKELIDNNQATVSFNSFKIAISPSCLSVDRNTVRCI